VRRTVEVGLYGIETLAKTAALKLLISARLTFPFSQTPKIRPGLQHRAAINDFERGRILSCSDITLKNSRIFESKGIIRFEVFTSVRGRKIVGVRMNRRKNSPVYIT
jgi:hypothetical protein